MVKNDDSQFKVKGKFSHFFFYFKVSKPNNFFVFKENFVT